MISIVGSRRLLFLGDADPPDLLIFAWLRERIGISYLGVTDDLLDKFGVSLDDAVTLTLSDFECAATPLMAHYYKDMAGHVGQRCCELLNSGRHRI